MVQIHWRSEYLDRIMAGEIVAKWSADRTRILRYYVDFRHVGLAIHKELSAPDINILQSKVDALMDSWDRRYADQLRKTTILSGKGLAEQSTLEATQKREALSQILQHTLRVDDRINWEALKDRSTFVAPQFLDRRPQRTPTPSPSYERPKITFWDFFFARKRSKIEASEKLHRRALAEWRQREEQAQRQHAESLARWDKKKEAHDRDVELQRIAFVEAQAASHLRVDELRAAVARGDRNAVIEQMTMVLDASDYDGLFEPDFDIDYDVDTRTLMVDYSLPSPDEMPRVKSAKFHPSTGEIVETLISEREQKQNFDLACYQIALRTIHELLEADEAGNIGHVSFNGFTSYVDRATGRDTRSCIMSVLVRPEDFETFDLARVDPKACFKALKGVSAASLASLAPVAPVLKMDREDRRFVEARDSVSGLSAAMNLAAMAWEDFEHLVKQLFELEFASRGGEVRVTRASRDGGVDAVAFDPDPITGGKIVIQAKRYTRTVGVSAVRDLFGTIMNEGASRGILVTTADYGPDAYEFANGKPISLFSGSHLLHMLERHGFKAKIDIAEARRLLGSREREAY